MKRLAPAICALAALLLSGCFGPALNEGVATAGDAAAKLWLAGRGITACGTAPPAPPPMPAKEPSVDQLMGAMAYGATLQRDADEVKESATELQRIAAELLAAKAKAAEPAPAPALPVVPTATASPTTSPAPSLAPVLSPPS